MITARDMMTPDATCVRASETIVEAARKMAELGVGALPICGADERLHGMLTDRDVVLKVLAEGKDPAACKAGDLAQDEIVTVGADDTADQVLRVMSEHRIRRVPVIDQHVLVGIITEADVARTLPATQVGGLVAAIATAA
ncbi:CBS domain-containing protein [Streptomyces vilmorinianum]|uniref:CBS domain-containing protein n=1 Tax=Streptomyces vilmorinianum TaxID=3051092 RepID=UPI0010FB1374|nr:CBS domain-containing protein [Streptomyces vilmorinianum]